MPRFSSRFKGFAMALFQSLCRTELSFKSSALRSAGFATLNRDDRCLKKEREETEPERRLIV
jgi:hypothetical protein